MTATRRLVTSLLVAGVLVALGSSQTLSSQTLSSQTLSSQTLPSQTLPSKTLSPQTLPSQTLSSQAASSSLAAPSLQRSAGSPPDGQAAFATVARILRHPRCLNCHPSGDRPRVGEDRRLHAMNVQRGATDHGAKGLHCLACHQPSNQDLVGVPGAPHWHLAPRSMGWEGLDDHALAEALKDRRRNGNRALADLLTHMEKDALVGWAWEPGAGLAAPSIARAEFVEAFRTWIDSGAPSPPPGKTTY